MRVIENVLRTAGWGVWVVAGLGLAMMGMARGDSDVVRARAFELVGKSGATLGRWHVTSPTSEASLEVPVLALTSPSVPEQAVQVSVHGVAILRKGTLSASLAVGNEGAVGVRLFDGKGVPRVTVGKGEHGRWEILLSDNKGVQVLLASAED